MVVGQQQWLNVQRWIVPLLGISSALLYGVVMLRLPLEANVLDVQRTINHVVANEWMLAAGITLLIVLLLGSYVLGAVAFRRELAASNQLWHSRLLTAQLFGFPALFCTLLFWTFPITSADVYDYLFRGWMLVQYHLNPLVVPPRALPNEPLLPYVAWPHAVSAYGPLWERLSACIAWFTAQRPGAASADVVLFRLVLGYKALGIIGYALCGLAIWASLGGATRQSRRLGVYLWLWNPLVLWETVGAAHNDVWLALPVVVAIWAWRIWRERRVDLAQRLSPTFVLMALTAGGLIKFLAFFFGPLALAALLRKTKGWRARLRLVVLSGIMCLILATVAYWPFWDGWATFQNIGDRRELYSATWLAALHPLLSGAFGRTTASNVTSLLGLGLLVIGMLVATWRVWNHPERLDEAITRLVLWFLLGCNPWFQPWYLVWAVALLAATPWSPLCYAIGVFCTTAALSYVVSGWLLPALNLDQPPFVRELLMALFVCGPPLSALVWSWLRGRHALTPTSGSAIMPTARPRSSVDRATVS